MIKKEKKALSKAIIHLLDTFIHQKA